jgi:hypothetical protein
VSAAADGVTDHAEHGRNDADQQHDNADRPEDDDVRDEPDDAEDDQLWLLAVRGEKLAAARVQGNIFKLPPRGPPGIGQARTEVGGARSEQGWACG